MSHARAALQATLEATTDGVLVTDEVGKVTGFNGNFLRMWGIERETLERNGEVTIFTEVSERLVNPVGYEKRLAEIHQEHCPETYDLVEFSDGRVFERHGRIQWLGSRPAGRVWTFRDISRRVQVQRELGEQTEWLSITLRSIGDAVLTVDTEGLVTFLNEAAEKLTGWRGGEALGRGVEELMTFIDQDTRKPFQNPILAALERDAELPKSNHTRLIRRDGGEVPIEHSAAPIRNATGEVLGAVMVVHDMSDRHRQQEAVARSEERFRLLSEVVPQLLWITDPDGHFEYCNERWYTYTGQTPETANGMGWADAIHPDDRESVVQKWKQCVQNADACESEYRLRANDGGYRWFVARSVPLLDKEGRIVRWYGSCTEFHQQKLTADALREEYTVTEQLREVATALATELDLSKVVQIITDAATRITRAQFGAFFYNVTDAEGGTLMLYTLSGVSREQFEKFPMPRATHLFGPTFRGDGVIRGEDIRNDPRFGNNPPFQEMPPGHLPVVSYLAVPVFARSGEVLGGLFFGHSEPAVFTERDERILVSIAAQAASAMNTARLYQAEQQARAAAEQANQAKDLFLAALSHELRTPLTPALAILSSLHEDDSVPPGLRRELEIVERNVELEARLIDDLLDLTRITRGKLELRRQSVDVLRIIESALDTCREDLAKKQLVLEKELVPPTHGLVADDARITQILWNLLKNAVKFTPKGGKIAVRSRELVEEGLYVIEVSDTGIGIEPEQLAHVFDAFEQGNRHITRQFGGLGLGLAISRAISEAHGGSLSAQSAGAGQGATFMLTLPLQKTGAGAATERGGLEPPRAEAQPPIQSMGEDSRPLRILLVEDHPDTAAVLGHLLRRMGHEVRAAGTLAQARHAAAVAAHEGGLDLLVSDLGLPDGSGLELMRELSQKYRLRGIALSGFGMESDLQQSAAAGFTRHLIKPLDIAEFRAVIEEVARPNSP